MAASIAEDRSPKVIKQGYIKKKGMKMSHDRHQECLFLKENYITQTCFRNYIILQLFIEEKTGFCCCCFQSKFQGGK